MINLNTIFNISILITLIGCGTYEVPKTELVEAEGECGEEVRVCSSEEGITDGVEDGTEESKETPKTSNPNVSVVVDVNVSVDVAVTTESGDIVKYYFNPKSKSQTKHMETAPEGYRLASRVEVLSALENGELKEVLDIDTILWTRTDSVQTTEMAWVIGYYDDYTTLKSLAFPALFIAQ